MDLYVIHTCNLCHLLYYSKWCLGNYNNHYIHYQCSYTISECYLWKIIIMLVFIWRYLHIQLFCPSLPAQKPLYVKWPGMLLQCLCHRYIYNKVCGFGVTVLIFIYISIKVKVHSCNILLSDIVQLCIIIILNNWIIITILNSFST